MSHSPATPSEWEPDAEATRPLPQEGQESDAAPGEPPAAEAGDAPAENAWEAPAEDPWEAPAEDPWEAPADGLGDASATHEDAPEAEPDTFAEDSFAEDADAFAAREEIDAAASAEQPDAPAADPDATQVFASDPDATQVFDVAEESWTVETDDQPSGGTFGDEPLGDETHPDDTFGEGAPDADASEAPPAGDAPESDGEGSSARKPLVFLAAGLAVLLIVVGIVWAVISTANTNRDKAIAQTATTYLSSIASGDAQAALATLADKPANTALLTGEVLTASRSTAPLTDIQVGTPVFDGGSAATVPASYRIGDQAVSTTLHLEGDGRTQWLISDGTADLTLSSTAGLTVNSAKVTEGTNPVFPGSYTVATGTDNVSIEGTPQAVVASPDAEPTALDVTAVLSETGKQNVLTTVKTRFDECLASTEARPADCPFGVRTDDVEVTPGSVKFALVNDPWAGFAPTLDAANLSATGPLAYVIDATATVSQNGLTTEGTTRLERSVAFTVDLTKDPLVVVWS